MRVFEPFSGDQALFLVAAEKLHAGGILYRDFWDIKQPAIFAFFLAGGSLFGFTQIGSHVADVVWQLAFSVAIVFALRDALDDARWAAFGPIAVVGAYFAGSSPWHLLQVEELVGLPLFCTAWCAIAALGSERHRRSLAVASGIAAGIAILFKLLFVGIAVAITLTALAIYRRRLSARSARAFVAAWCIGACVPIAAFAAYALSFGIARDVVQTFFVLPFELVASPAHAPIARLADSALRFVLYFRGIVFLALVGVFVHDVGTRTWRIVSVVWLVVAAITIVVQSDSWWQYHFLLLLPPLGVLATCALAAVARRIRSSGLAGFAWLGVCGVAAYVAVPLPQGAIDDAIRVARERPYASADRLERYRALSSSEYAQASRDAAFLRATNDRSDVYVFGNPLIYVLGERAQAVAMNGWALQLYTPPMWDRLNAELRSSRPAAVFVLGQYANGMLERDAPATAALLARDYAAATTTADGAWLRSR